MNPRPFSRHRFVPVFAILSLAGCSSSHGSGDGARAAPKAAPEPAQNAGAASGSSPDAASLDWRSLEAPLLTEHLQLTSRDKFVKAGEAYFDHHSPPRWIIFQAVAVPAEGQEADPFYAMYVAPLRYDQHGICGIDEPIKISPPGAANTCGWFDPVSGYKVIFGSTLVRPSKTQHSGFQVGTRSYVWAFPKEMDIVSRTVPDIFRSIRPNAPQPIWTGDAISAKPVFTRPNYDAECSFSHDGRFILYSHVRDEPTRGKDDADIWLFDTQTGEQHELVHADGYDGGPFFSPDDKRICYRSDRVGNDLLQLFVADLKFDSSGIPVGIEREHQVTNNEHVNWAPYWHPSGEFLLYGTSELGHTNYEVFAVETPAADASAKTAAQLRKRRITFASGADVLPVFSDDGEYMMWTAQRGPMAEGEQKPSSQIWVARFRMPYAPARSTDLLFLPRFDPPHTENGAIEIARKVMELYHDPQRLETANYEAKRDESGWLVLVNLKPVHPAPATTGNGLGIFIDQNGCVTRIEGGG